MSDNMTKRAKEYMNIQEKLPEKYQTVRLYLQLMKYNR